MQGSSIEIETTTSYLRQHPETCGNDEAILFQVDWVMSKLIIFIKSEFSNPVVQKMYFFAAHRICSSNPSPCPTVHSISHLLKHGNTNELATMNLTSQSHGKSTTRIPPTPSQMTPSSTRNMVSHITPMHSLISPSHGHNLRKRSIKH